MNWNDPQLILAIIRGITIHGVSFVLVVADILRSEKEITVQDIENLRITKKPEDYF